LVSLKSGEELLSLKSFATFSLPPAEREFDLVTVSKPKSLQF
jgi:hypothetical protein